jgi:hypothetical protein
MIELFFRLQINGQFHKKCILLQHDVAVRCTVQRIATESSQSEQLVLHLEPPPLFEKS